MKRSLLKLALSVCSIGSGLLVYGQPVPSAGLAIPMNQPSENASALTRSGNVPVNFSTGQPVIDIPLHQTSYSDINIPISLNYDASGVRVDQHPTWVGQNFNLRVGGVITRNVKGMPDDYLFPDDNGSHYANTEKGYLFCGNKLNIPNWNTPQSLSAYAFYYASPGVWNSGYLADGMPDDYNFEFGGYSGTLFLDEQGIWRVKSQSNLALEVSHEVNTGPLIFDVDTGSKFAMKLNKLITKFTIITPDGMKYIFGGNLNAMDYSRGAADNFNINFQAPRTFNISPSAWYLTQIISPQGAIVNFTYERGLNLVRYYRTVQASYYATSYSSTTTINDIGLGASIITPCYLKSIVTPLQTITFNRSQATQQIFDGITWIRRTGSTPEERPLTEFDKQLYFDDASHPYRGWTDFRYPKSVLEWFPNPSQRIKDFSQKLDSIVVQDNFGNVRKKVRFNYNNIASERLFLNGLSISGNDFGQDDVYAFDYFDKDQVPNYSTLQKDQWGYFNGSNYLSGPMYSSTAWRLASLPYALKGTLKAIKYPTGGKAGFEFELNTYAQFQKVNLTNPLGGTGTVALESTGTNTEAGGLRIKKITSSAGYRSPDVIKSYFYNKNYVAGGATSSGILSSRSKYIEHNKFANFCAPGSTYLTLFSDNEFNPYGEDVRAVSYGEVTEVTADGSKTTYRYSNYDDPGCLDELDNYSFLFNVEESDLFKLTSNSLERGLLLSESHYNSANQKVHDKIYDYDYATDRKQKFGKGVQRFDRIKENVRADLYSSLEICADISVHRLYTYKKYYYNIPLKKVTENYYYVSSIVSNSQSFSYDAYGNCIAATTVASDGQEITTNTRYNSHPDYLGSAVSSDAVGIKRLFDQYRIKNYPIEKTTITSNPLIFGSGLMTGGTLFRYNQNFPYVDKIMRMELSEPFKPVTWSGMTPTYHYAASGTNGGGNFEFDSRYKLQESVTAASTNLNMLKGKPLSLSKVGGPEVYTWDYRTQYITSITRNAELGQTAYTSFEGQYQVVFPLASDDNMGYWNFNKNNIALAGIGGNKSLNLPLGSGVNLSSVASLQNGKQYVLSFWYKGDFPQLKNGNIFFGVAFPAADDWTFVEYPFTGNGGQLSFVAPPLGMPFVSCNVDEVRLYPAGASMTTATYDPFNGKMTSEGNENGDLRLYRYDNLSRLIDIRDSKGNIIKHFFYQNQRPQ